MSPDPNLRRVLAQPWRCHCAKLDSCALAGAAALVAAVVLVADSAPAASGAIANSPAVAVARRPPGVDSAIINRPRIIMAPPPTIPMMPAAMLISGERIEEISSSTQHIGLKVEPNPEQGEPLPPKVADQHGQGSNRVLIQGQPKKPVA